MQASRPAGKSASAFRTISEVSEELDVPQHVLRFWEGKFSQVRPLKRGGGRRYYRPEDIALLKRIRDLLYSEGYTIKGVQKLLREGRAKDDGAAAEPAGAPPAGCLDGQKAQEINEIIAELSELRDLLKSANKRAG
ncbi:MAG TPA: MerR family transcriptional regulator [Kiloniellaceae bacterium]|nr:MerR family transcriptional regulator [Kiloniellaceae bacterium]